MGDAAASSRVLDAPGGEAGIRDPNVGFLAHCFSFTSDSGRSTVAARTARFDPKPKWCVRRRLAQMPPKTS